MILKVHMSKIPHVRNSANIMKMTNYFNLITRKKGENMGKMRYWGRENIEGE
jgi:hypothetical protein